MLSRVGHGEDSRLCTEIYKGYTTGASRGVASRILSFGCANVRLVNLSADGAVPEGPAVQREGRLSLQTVVEPPRVSTA